MNALTIICRGPRLPRPVSRPGRRTAAAAGLAVLMMLAVGCGSGVAPGSSASAGGPRRGGNLVIDIATPQQDFDVNTTSDNESIWTLDQIAQTLFINSPTGRSVQPELATSYTLSPDRLSWTFQLRHGVRFSTGKPMTSKDVVFSLQQALNPKSIWNFIDAPIKSVRADGPYAVTITTKTPWSPLLADLALFANAIFPANWGGETRAQFFQHPVGTGPFKMASWIKGQSITLVRNPYYWQKGKPYLNSVTYNAVSDANTRVTQLRAGQADVIEQAPYAVLKSLATSGYRLGLFPSTRIDYVTMNELFKPFRDPHVRLAISYALDTSAIMRAVFFGYGRAADSPLMPTVSYYSPVGLHTSNLALARRELAASHYPHGGFTIDFIVGSGDPVQVPVAQIVQNDLKPLNIHVKIRLLDPSQVTAQEQSFHFGMRETYWTMDIVDPDEYISFVLCGTCGAYANWTHFDDPQIDRLTRQAESTFNAATERSLYTTIQKLAAADAPIVWLGYSPYDYVYSGKVHGFRVYPEGNAHLENVWLSG
jgi:peptide/nickel transport system substrate-binding protein